MESTRPVQIVIPLHKGGGKLRNNTELKYVLRGLERHLKEPYEVTIIGRALPAWSQGLKLIPEEGGLKRALQAAAKAYPEGWIWQYDDCVPIRDTTVEEMKITVANQGWSTAQTGWARDLDRIKERLVKEGYKAWDYSRPHGPYWFDAGMVAEGFEDWPRMKGKFPWESWILSKRDWPRRHGVVRQYYGAFDKPPGDWSYFVNFNHPGFTEDLRKWLDERFPEPSRYEKAAGPAPFTLVRDVPAGTGKVSAGAVEVHTIRWGNEWWMKLCAPSLDAWCGRHCYDLRVWGREHINPAYPDPKFCEVDMLREFLAGDAEWMLYVDADVYVDPQATGLPGPDGSPPAPGLHMRTNREHQLTREWPGWCVKQFGKEAARGAGKWSYRNAGVWLCDRASSELLLAAVSEPYIARVMEQHQFNWWAFQAVRQGLVMRELPERLNGWPDNAPSRGFYHLLGSAKRKQWQKLVNRGLAPALTEKGGAVGSWEFPRAFDFEPYRWVWGLPMAMDEYHIQLLHVACGLDTGKPPLERVAVEIGSHKGASTAALIEAVNRGMIGHLHVVELKPTAELREVMAQCEHPERVKLHTKASWETDIDGADFVFIDGNHEAPALTDTLWALTRDAAVICLHDSRSFPAIKCCWGATRAARLLREMKSRHHYEDAEAREGLSTQRGFLVSAPLSVPLDAFKAYPIAQGGGEPMEPEPMRGLKDALEEALAGAKEVQYQMPNGNAGDAVISYGTQQVLDALGVKIVPKAAVVLLGGGGNLTAEYRSAERILRGLPRKGKRVIVLPSTVTAHWALLREFSDLTLMAREAETWQRAKREQVAAMAVHDAAFSIDYTRWREAEGRDTKDVLYAFRTDGESKGRKPPAGNRDLSAELGEGKWSLEAARHAAELFIEEINAYRLVHTDRAHVAIVAGELGKQVELWAGSYHKNESIHAASMGAKVTFAK